jgi:hypothetical protein
MTETTYESQTSVNTLTVKTDPGYHVQFTWERDYAVVEVQLDVGQVANLLYHLLIWLSNHD